MFLTMQNLSAAAQLDLGVRLKRGDQDVLNGILHAFGGRIARTLRTTFPSLREPDVEEILAESLFRVWTNRASYAADKGSLLAWFTRIARNVAIDALKPRWRQAQALERPFPDDDTGRDALDRRSDAGRRLLP